MTIRRILTLFVGLIAAVTAMADGVRVDVSAPSSVALGRNFQIAYVVNGDAESIALPEVDGLDVLMGPSTSRSSSYSFINGKMESSKQTTFTYVVKAIKAGTISVSPAKVTAGGKTLEARGVNITVVASADAPSSAGGSSQGGDAQRAVSSGGEDLFLRQTLTRQSVYEGEATQLVTKVYTRVNLNSLSDIVPPKLSEFVVSDLSGGNITFSTEFINGREYQVGEISRKVLIPQQSGKIVIDPCEVEFVVKRRIRGGGFFDDLFGDVQVSRQKVRAPQVTLNVKPLPAGKPAGFSGGVGQFKFSVEVEPRQTTVDNSVQVRVSVEGAGNLKLISLPKPQFHQDFDTFDPSPKNNIEETPGGFSGKRSDEYLIIPRRDGKFEIPQMQFSYFDPSQGRYVKQTQGPFGIDVAKGDGKTQSQSAGVSFAGSGPERVTYTGSDLRYLHRSGSLSQRGSFFVFSPLFWVLFLVPIVALVVLFFIYRKRVYDHANMSLVKSRKANKMARKRLKMAAKYIKEGKREAFFDEVMRSLWGYLSDKLTLSLSELTKDNAREKMASHGVDPKAADDFMALLDECEFARYAPASVSATMDDVYARAIAIIEKIDAKKQA